jgi:hypothetical protein
MIVGLPCAGHSSRAALCVSLLAVRTLRGGQLQRVQDVKCFPATGAEAVHAMDGLVGFNY